MATASIFCKEEGLSVFGFRVFLLEIYHLINFSFGGNKKSTGGFHSTAPGQRSDARWKDIQCFNFKIQFLLL